MEEQACEAETGCVGAEVYGKGMGDERETTECRKRWSARGADGCWFSLGSNGEWKGMRMETSGSVQGWTERAMEW